MEAIRKYNNNFYKKHKENITFSMTVGDLFDAAHLAETGGSTQAISETFRYGYAKGYRAALSEMKKGGAV